MSVDFAHLLNVKADDIKELPVLPQGQYLARIGQYEYKDAKTKNGDKPVLEFPLQLTSRVSGEGDLPPKLPEMKHTFWLTKEDGTQDEYTLNPLKVFLEAAGVSTDGRSILEAVAEVAGNMLTVNIVHNPNKNNPARPYANIKGFAAA